MLYLDLQALGLTHQLVIGALQASHLVDCRVQFILGTGQFSLQLLHPLTKAFDLKYLQFYVLCSNFYLRIQIVELWHS